VPPHDHPTLFCSSGLTLNITRAAMAATGYCPSGRLFEAAGCGAPIISDWWEGLDQFFEPERELFIAAETGDVLRALDLPAEERQRVAARARARTLECHSATVRAHEFERLLESCRHQQAGAA
jgi:spore maturation protein CgeB